jgi:hypothetical protein
LRFNGSSTRVAIAHIAAYASVLSVSIEAWVRIVGNATGVMQILNKGDYALNPGQSQFGFALNYTASIGGLATYYQWVYLSNWYWDLPASANIGGLGNGGWVHVAGTFNQAATYNHKHFVNGEYNAVFSPANVPPTNLYAVWIGACKSGAGGASWFIGDMCEVRLWDGVRSPDLIKQNMDKTLTGNEPGLLGYWPLNEMSGTTAYDKTVYANNGTITDGAWLAT